MANSRDGNVIYVDTTASFADARSIEGIKYIGNTGGSAVITSRVGTNPLWRGPVATDITFDDVCIRADEGITVTIAGGAAVYIYLKV